MSKNFVFGNLKYENSLGIGSKYGIKLLANIGHMDAGASYEDEQKKTEIAWKNEVDIIADNTITEKSLEFKKWIKKNYPMMLNTVPVYDCFNEMESGKFVYSELEEAISRHIDIGADMIVTHPTVTHDFAQEVANSARIIKITSRGGSQIYRYMLRYEKENPYYEHWDEICKIAVGTGAAIAIGLSLRSGSILDDMEPLFLKELDIAGTLIERAEKWNIPVVVEGIGHVRRDHMRALLLEVKSRCHDVPVKTLGPLLSDRMIGNEHINSLLGSYCAAQEGAAIVGALFRSEHLGLPTVAEYEESLENYRMLKYIFNMSEKELETEKCISVARSNREWGAVLGNAFYQDKASEQFHKRYGKCAPETCTMCGKRCAMRQA